MKQFEELSFNYLSLKGLNDVCHGLEGMKFSRKNVIEFHALCHLPSGRNILMTVTPNLTKSKPMETRHLELSRDIKFEEIRVRKDLQKIA